MERQAQGVTDERTDMDIHGESVTETETRETKTRTRGRGTWQRYRDRKRERRQSRETGTEDERDREQVRMTGLHLASERGSRETGWGHIPGQGASLSRGVLAKQGSWL